jgi:hypothetical protein
MLGFADDFLPSIFLAGCYVLWTNFLPVNISKNRQQNITPCSKYLNIEVTIFPEAISSGK